MAFLTFPALMQDEQTRTLLTTPLITALTLWRLGSCLCTCCLWENEIFAALMDFFPHISHTIDICTSFQTIVSYTNIKIKIQEIKYRNVKILNAPN